MHDQLIMEKEDSTLTAGSDYFVESMSLLPELDDIQNNSKGLFASSMPPIEGHIQHDDATDMESFACCAILTKRNTA